MIDLCPVGALTSKPYAFNARPWELRKTESIDVMDALGSSIRIDAKGDGVMRIMPLVNEEVNEEWLSDKSRFIWDGLARQRLDKPYIRENGKLRPATWQEALELTAEALGGPADKIGFVAGDLVEVEQVKAAYDLAQTLGIKSIDCRPAGARYGADGVRERYILNPTLMGVEEADVLLLIGTNPRLEAAVWNARIRKAWLWNELSVGVVGEAIDLTYDYEYLGNSTAALSGLFASEGKFAEALKSAKKPMIVVGEQALCREDGAAILKAAHDLALSLNAVRDDWAGFGVLHSAAARVGALDAGFIPGDGGVDTAGILSGQMDTVVLLGVDECDLSQTRNSKVIYIGHHGDAGASAADIILPCAAYTEMTATYVNTEGRVQMSQRAVQPKGDAKEGWAIWRALSAKLGKPLPYDTADELRKALREDEDKKTVFAGLNFAPGAAGAMALKQPIDEQSSMQPAALALKNEDFYLTNPIARASKTMAECSMQKRRLVQPVAAE